MNQQEVTMKTETQPLLPPEEVTMKTETQPLTQGQDGTLAMSIVDPMVDDGDFIRKACAPSVPDPSASPVPDSSRPVKKRSHPRSGPVRLEGVHSNNRNRRYNPRSPQRCTASRVEGVHSNNRNRRCNPGSPPPCTAPSRQPVYQSVAEVPAAGEFDLIRRNELVLEDRILGQGQFGKVHVGILHGLRVAVKEPLAAQFSTLERRNQFLQEVKALRNIRNPYVVQFLGVCPVEKNILIVTELLSGDLFTLLHDSKNLSTELCAHCPVSLPIRIRLCRDAALGLQWLHDHLNIAHGDVKPANFLLSVEGNFLGVKVSDFGFARFLSTSELQKPAYEKAVVPSGTPLYMAPELWRGGSICLKSDMYAFGVMIWEIVTCRFPFDHLPQLNHTSLSVGVVNGLRPEFPSSLLKQVPNLCKMVSACWTEPPELRPHFREVSSVLEHSIVDSMVSSESGRLFWYIVSHHYKPALDSFSVMWPDFVATFKHFSGEVPSNELTPLLACAGAEEKSVLRIAQDALQTPNLQKITMRGFEICSHIFGEFWLDPLLLGEMKSLVKASWFHGFTDRSTTENLLRGNTFLIRCSTREPTKEPFTLSKSQGRNVVHRRIQRIQYEYSGDAHRYRITTGTPRCHFELHASNLHDLVQAMQSRGSLTNPCPTEPKVESYYSTFSLSLGSQIS